MHRQTVNELVVRQNMNVNHAHWSKTTAISSNPYAQLFFFPAVLLSASLALQLSSRRGFLCLEKLA